MKPKRVIALHSKKPFMLYLRECANSSLLRPARAAFMPSPSPSNSAVAEHFSNIKLPKLELSKFFGNYEEWFPFFDAFNSLIHVNASLSNVQRLQYLRSSVTGDAAKIISALEISGANYEVAWNLLRERYDNKRLIVQSCKGDHGLAIHDKGKRR